MTGNVEDAYVAKETPMNFYLNIHTALEQMRSNADINKTSGPRVVLFFFKFFFVKFNNFFNLGNGCWTR
jgi:hypothetical protein